MANLRPLVLLFIIAGCAGGEKPGLPEPELWGPAARALPDANYFAARPWLESVSAWSSTGCGRGQPDEARQMGDFGVGNGHVFALTGYACPINTLHTMIGPGYEKHSGFFEDTWLRVEADAEAHLLQVLEGRVFRVRRTPITISYERSVLFETFTLNFAPLGSADEDTLRAIVRVAVIRNISDIPVSGVRIVTEGASATRDEQHRTLACLDTGHDDPHSVLLDELQPGEEKSVELAYVVYTDEEDESATVTSLRAAGADTLLEDTRQAWLDRLEPAAMFECPDQRVVDLYYGMLVTTLSQRSNLGGIGVMSQYTGMWLRNMSGPARFLSRIGLHEPVRDMLEYYYLAARVEGDIRNSVALDLEPGQQPTEPEWDELPPFEGRVAAESPSYLPLMVDWYTKASGDQSLVEEQYGMLMRALAGQAIDGEWRLPFSGDETFRTAMAITEGFVLDYEYKVCCKSANSSFLYSAAAGVLADWAEELGNSGDAVELRQEAKLVRQSAETTYRDDSGAYLAYVSIDNPGQKAPVFEDVATKVLWCGYLSPSDERAISNVSQMVDILARPDGFLVSPLHPSYDNALELDIHEGVHTGMSPGYSLYNLAAVDHPLGDAAFDALGLTVSSSGNAAEYQIYDDHSALQLVYDASGTLGDYTARYMNWEGSILLDAMVYFLTGFEPDAQSASATLAPRLPNAWPEMKWSDLRVGDRRFDLLVEELGGERRISVTAQAGTELTVHLSVPLPEVELHRITVNDNPLAADDYTTWSPFGQTRIVLPGMLVSVAEPLLVSIEYD